MSSETMAFRQHQLNELYREISSYNILAESYQSHPNITSQMAAKNPVATLQIPIKLFLLWSELRGIQVPAPTYTHLVKCSLKDNTTGLTIFPNTADFEDRLRKECSRVCKKYRSLRSESSKERLGKMSYCVCQ